MAREFMTTKKWRHRLVVGIGVAKGVPGIPLIVAAALRDLADKVETGEVPADIGAELDSDVIGVKVNWLPQGDLTFTENQQQREARHLSESFESTPRDEIS